MNTIIAAAGIAASVPAIGNHAYIVYKSKQWMMAVPAPFGGIVAFLAALLFTISCNDTAVYI